MALLFDGVNDQVSYGDVNALDAIAKMTIDLDLYIETLAINKQFTRKNTGAAGWRFCTTSTASTFIFIFEGVTSISQANKYEAGEWHRWTLVFDGSLAGNARFKAYKDGVALSLSYSATPPATTANTAAVLEVGMTTASGAHMRVANYKVWAGVALTPEEVALQVTMARPIRTDGLTVWSPYDESPASARDYSGLGNHGTISGPVLAPGPPVAHGGMAA